MAFKNCNTTLECSICKKIRKRHWLKRHNNFDFKITVIVRGFLKDKGSKPSSNKDLALEIVANGKVLDEKRALDEKISKVLKETNTKEESLSKNTRKLLTCIKAES